jgi:long-chain acyl-CoA synthetase
VRCEQVGIPSTRNIFECLYGGSATWFLLSHAAAITSIELICVNTKIGQQELTHTITNIPATVVFTETALISRLLTPLVECPHVKLIIYDSTTEVEDDIEMVRNEVAALKKGLQNKVRIISVDELCLIGLEVLENFTPVIPTDKERIWGHMYPRSLNEFQLPMADTLTNGNVAAGCMISALDFWYVVNVMAVAGMHHALKTGLAKDDTYLSYLPMYFRLEYNLINTLFMSGCTVAFGTDVEKFVLSAPYNERICPASYGDALSFCPTILWGIRPWWDDVHTQLAKAISMLPLEEKDDFWRYLEKKRIAVSSRIVPHPVVHMLERRGHIDRVRLGFFGDRIRWIGNTCSMMTVEMREFLGLVLGGPRGIMVEGWTLPSMNA